MSSRCFFVVVYFYFLKTQNCSIYIVHIVCIAHFAGKENFFFPFFTHLPQNLASLPALLLFHGWMPINFHLPAALFISAQTRAGSYILYTKKYTNLVAHRKTLNMTKLSEQKWHFFKTLAASSFSMARVHLIVFSVLKYIYFLKTFHCRCAWISDG